MDLKRVHRHMDLEFPDHLRRTQDFLRQPSVSAEGIGLLETAQWLATYLCEIGGRVDLTGKEDAPIVFARIDLGKPRTLLVYGMYDVQPVAGQAWTSPPFGAEIRTLSGIGPCIIARGACNSKGPLVGFLNALQTIREVDEIPVNLILTIEGEEELGSPSLPLFYQQHRDELKMADAGFEPFWANYGTDVDKPTVSLGNKGIETLELICRAGDWGGPTQHPVHSSTGAWLSSPTWRLVKALSTFVGDREEILIDGFYEDVAAPSLDDEQLLNAMAADFSEERTLSILGAHRFKHDLRGSDLLRAYLFSPSISVGIAAQGDGDTIPSEARARVVIRTVPNMVTRGVAEQVRYHLDRRGYGDIDVVVVNAYPWSRTSIHAEVVQCMIETYRYHGIEPQVLPIMASATPYYLFSDVLHIPYVWGGLGQAGGSHAPDEYLSVEGLKIFEKSIATFLHKFGESG